MSESNAGLMALTRVMVVQARLSAAIVNVLAEKGSITRQQGAAVIRDSAKHLATGVGSRAILDQFQGIYEQLAVDCEGSRPR